MLTRIYADNFRSFVNFELRPAKMSLLLGDNGGGKTSVLDVLWGVRSIARHGEEAAQAFPAVSRTAWEQRTTQRFELEVQASDGTYLYVLEVEHPQSQQQATSHIRSETVTFDGHPLFRYADSKVQLFKDDYSKDANFQFSNRRSFLSNLEPSAGKQRLTRLLTWLDRLLIFKLDPTKILGSWWTRSEAQGLSRDGDNFAAFYRHLVQERPEVASEVQKDLQSQMPGFQQFRLQTLGDAKCLLVKLSPKQETECELPFLMLSDGQAVLVVLYTLLHAIAGRTSLICIDEPDNFVALPEIQPWLLRLSEILSNGDTQALLVSHHPEVIDYLASESAVRLERPGGGLTRVSAATVNRESGEKLSEILARGLPTENAQ